MTLKLEEAACMMLDKGGISEIQIKKDGDLLESYFNMGGRLLNHQLTNQGSLLKHTLPYLFIIETEENNNPEK